MSILIIVKIEVITGGGPSINLDLFSGNSGDTSSSQAE